MLQEKHRFRKYPQNYAMRKTQLMKERDMALAKYFQIFSHHHFIGNVNDVSVLLIVCPEQGRGRGG